MPIYEFHCVACNRVFSFWSQTIAGAKEPVCPKCGAKRLKKLFSKFAVTGAQRKSRGTTAAEAQGAPVDPAAGMPPGGDGPDPFADPRVEAEMTRLMEDAEGLDEKDPRQLGRLMRRMTELTGEKMDKDMSTAIRRLEAGEDPEKIEEDMGDALGGPAGPGGAGAAPSYDDGLYDM